MKLDKSAPCHCGSNLEYRHCHFPIDRAGPQHRVKASQTHYLGRWSENARCFEDQGCYEWMAEQLSEVKPKRIFDVGCGDGRAIRALALRYGGPGFQIISFEENSECLKQAQDYLRNQRQRVSVVRRCETVTLGPEEHALCVKHGRLKCADGINLIEGDFLVDEEIDSFLDTQPKFDAMTVWLIGTHDCRIECANLRPLGIENPGDYRLRLQRRAYLIANEILCPGGVLSLVDRADVERVEQGESLIIADHKEIAAHLNTSLEVEERLEVREYRESESTRRIAMSRVFNSPQNGVPARVCLMSVRALKR